MLLDSFPWIWIILSLILSQIKKPIQISYKQVCIVPLSKEKGSHKPFRKIFYAKSKLKYFFHESLQYLFSIKYNKITQFMKNILLPER